jgi:hypothetical protein
MLHVDIPQYGPDPRSEFWNRTIGNTSPNITRTTDGSFSYSPVRNILGSMLDGASLATAPNASFQTHRKLDNTGYTFHGRFYGAGGSVGLAALPSVSGLQQYSFFEDGYLSNVTCWYNDTMDFHVYLGQQTSSIIDPIKYPDLYLGCGYISSGSYECIAFPGYGDKEVVALLGNPYQGRNIWGIATGADAVKYASLNGTSCEVVFNRKTFAVSVDLVEKLINVTATERVPDDIDPTSAGIGLSQGQLALNVVQQIGMVVQVSGSTEFSPLGNGKTL